MFVCGLMFLFVDVPDTPLLGNYRKARYMMAAAYLFFAGMSIAEFLFADLAVPEVPLLQAITLIIAVSQAILFTLALLALLEVRFPGWRYVFGKIAPALLIIIAVFTIYTFCSEVCFGVAFFAFCGLYALLLAYYTQLFMAVYRRFRFRMDNYFSDRQAEQMRWVAFSFFAALAVGVMALLSAVFMSALAAILFAVVFNSFYLWFAIRFINYAHKFRVIEHVLDNEQDEEMLTEKPAAAGSIEPDGNDSAIFAKLEKQIEKWVAEKGFTQKGITIETLALELLTNRCYISTYINVNKRKTFREWINEMKIEEAKNLMRQYPDMPLSRIAEMTGFTDHSHLTRQFIKLMGETPKKWRQEV